MLHPQLAVDELLNGRVFRQVAFTPAGISATLAVDREFDEERNRLVRIAAGNAHE